MVYAPELDAYPTLDPSLAAYYQSQIGVFRRMVEIGRVDINNKILMLDSFLALFREGHIEAVLYVYGYLCAKLNTILVLDTSYPDINMSQLLQYDWK